MVTSGFFRGEKFDPDTDIPNLDGRVYLVTGGSTGIGFGIVAQVLQHKASKIILLSNEKEHANAAIEDLKQYGDISRISWQQCNLGSLKQTDEIAKKLKAQEARIDGLMLNAGIGVNKFALTEDGLDSHFQVNMLSQLHLALVLMPNLVATARMNQRPSRIVMMSSEMHRFPPSSCEFSSIQEVSTDVGATALYGRSKLAQVLCTRELAKRLEDGQMGFSNTPRLVIVNATHPGGVHTPQQDQFPAAYGETIGKMTKKLVRPLMTDPVKHGCRSGLFALTSEEMVEKTGDEVQGQYIMPDKKIADISKKGKDDAMAERLWNLSIGILKEKLGSLDYDFAT